jgi:DNA-directed RNA polymerase specialized sigma24 family protein
MHEVMEGIASDLVSTGTASLDSRARSAAAARVDSFLKKRARHYLGAHADHVARDHLADAIQEVLTAVLRGGFTRGTKHQATAWLRRVLLNSLRKQLRDRRRRLESDPRMLLELGSPACDEATELREATRAAATLLRAEIGRAARPRDVHMVELDFDLWVGAALGESTSSQIDHAGALLVRRSRSAPGPSDASRASARVRQRRRRGRIAATRALERLRATGSWPGELDFALGVLGLQPRER